MSKTFNLLSHLPLVWELHTGLKQLLSPLHSATNLVPSMEEQMPVFPSHVATILFPFCHCTVGRGEPLTVQRNVTLERSSTDRCCGGPAILAGEGTM